MWQLEGVSTLSRADDGNRNPLTNHTSADSHATVVSRIHCIMDAACKAVVIALVARHLCTIFRPPWYDTICCRMLTLSRISLFV